MPEWSAEVVVDDALARSLIAEQFPPLPERSLRLLGVGWDNTVFLVDDTWVFRFPRRAIAVPGFEAELAALPRLAPLVPLPIPVPVHVGRATDRFPWPFAGSRLIRGREACETGLDDNERVSLARPLARVLRSLHAPAVRGALDVPLRDDPNGRADMARRVPRALEQLGEVSRLGLWRVPERALELLDAAHALAAPEPTAVCHGDLHFRHVLIDERGHLSGLIDWIDVCRADPAIDLQLVWSFLPPASRAAFLDEYGAVSAEALLRARVLALSLNAALAAYGHHERLPVVEREALSGLDRTVEG